MVAHSGFSQSVRDNGNGLHHLTRQIVRFETALANFFVALLTNALLLPVIVGTTAIYIMLVWDFGVGRILDRLRRTPSELCGS